MAKVDDEWADLEFKCRMVIAGFVLFLLLAIVGFAALVVALIEWVAHA